MREGNHEERAIVPAEKGAKVRGGKMTDVVIPLR